MVVKDITLDDDITRVKGVSRAVYFEQFVASIGGIVAKHDVVTKQHILGILYVVCRYWLCDKWPEGGGDHE